MSIFDLYGLGGEDLVNAKEQVGKALGLNFIAHESSNHCGDYWRIDFPTDASLILQRNYDPFDEEWTEADFKDFPFLLYVSDHPDSDDLKRRLCDFVFPITHLRRRVFP